MKNVWSGWIILTVSLLFASACEQQADKSEWRSHSAPTEVGDGTRGPVITIGDVDPDTPTSRMQKIRPLADYVAAEMGWPGVRVKILVARSIEDISAMMAEGRVDVFVDSTYPTLRVKEKAGSRIILQSLVDGEKYYRSLIIAPAASGIQNLEQLVGQRLVLQEEYSTSGFLAPAALLLERGFALQRTGDQKQVPADRIGYLFSGDEENTLAMLRKGIAPAGAISSQDFEDLPAEVKAEFRIIAESNELPRKLASVRAGFDPRLLDQLIKVLLAIDDGDRQKMVSSGGWNWEFVVPDEISRRGLARVEAMMERVERLEGR